MRIDTNVIITNTKVIKGKKIVIVVLIDLFCENGGVVTWK